MIKEITVDNAFDKEIQPDNICVMTLDGYQGCQLQCPYCFQMNNKEWSKHILVRTNIVETLQTQLTQEQGINEIFIGSQSDPYMSLEKKYQLTKGLLELLCDKDYKVYIVTKSDNQLILRDKALLLSFKVPVTIIMGLANIRQANQGADNVNIAIANELKRSGLNVDVHITPILPYIMKVDEMIQAVDSDIDIYLDKLRVFTEGNQNQKIDAWIKKEYPEYARQYYRILHEEDDGYYKAIMNQYKANKRIHFLFQ